MLRQLYLALVLAGILIHAGTADASLQATRTKSKAASRAQTVAESQLPKPVPANAQVFSNTVLDPARCNYEYVDMYGAWVVRTELKLTCSTHQ
jgi:hypothetical protein